MTVVVAVVGSRDYPRLSDVDEHIADLAREHADLKIISGGARGVDSRARVACKDRGIAFEEYPADWSTGNGAGYVRNKQLVEMAAMVVAFWDGSSKGTKHTIDLALKARKNLAVLFP